MVNVVNVEKGNTKGGEKLIASGFNPGDLLALFHTLSRCTQEGFHTGRLGTCICS